MLRADASAESVASFGRSDPQSFQNEAVYVEVIGK